MSKASIPASIVTYVMTRFTCCVACGTWDAIECGHIVAESKGGAMVKENFVRLCGHCNRLQGVIPAEFVGHADYTESRALVETRRAQWAAYCKIARNYIAQQAKVESGKAKVNGYKWPKPYKPA